MKKTILVLCLLCSVLFLKAQFYEGFQTQTRPCQTDSTIQIMQFKHWDVYKTTNNEWDGTLDSSFCGAVTSDGELDLSNIAPNETVFLKYKFNNALGNYFLSANNLFQAGFDGYLKDSASLNFMDICPNGICTGMMVGVEIPDSTGTGYDMRWYQNRIEQSWGNSIRTQFCVASEYFNYNKIKEVILKITPNSSVGKVNFSQVHIEDVWSSTTIQDSIVAYHFPNDTSYKFDVYMPILAIKSDTTIYPNHNGIEYIDLIPSPNIDTVSTIDIIIDGFGSLIFQPFLELQGGYVLNDSSQRHHYNIINNGGNICLMFIERVFKNGNNYIHLDGSIDFGQRACMQFGRGSKLIVGEDATLHYGANGLGMLALCTGGSIDIKGELILNNQLLLQEYPEDTEPQQIYMTLQEGSKLTFGEYASITNKYSKDGSMKLNIYMKGGEIDMSQLDIYSRGLINLIYENAQPDFQDNIKILGNPTKDELRFSLVAEADGAASIQLLTIDGKVAFTSNDTHQKGMNYFNIPTNDLSKGLYILTIKTKEGIFTDKVLILK